MSSNANNWRFTAYVLNILEQALRKTRGNKKLAAEMLGLKRTTLTAKLKSLAAVGAAG